MHTQVLALYDISKKGVVVVPNPGEEIYFPGESNDGPAPVGFVATPQDVTTLCASSRATLLLGSTVCAGVLELVIYRDFNTDAITVTLLRTIVLERPCLWMRLLRRLRATVGIECLACDAQWVVARTDTSEVIVVPFDGSDTRRAHLNIGHFLPSGAVIYHKLHSPRLWLSGSDRDTYVVFNMHMGLPDTPPGGYTWMYCVVWRFLTAEPPLLLPDYGHYPLQRWPPRGVHGVIKRDGDNWFHFGNPVFGEDVRVSYVSSVMSRAAGVLTANTKPVLEYVYTLRNYAHPSAEHLDMSVYLGVTVSSSVAWLPCGTCVAAIFLGTVFMWTNPRALRSVWIECCCRAWH